MNILLLRGIATNLYSASGISVGTQIRVQNQSQQMLTLADSSAGLARDATGDCVTVSAFQSATNKSGSTGAWARAESGDCLINIVEA